MLTHMFLDQGRLTVELSNAHNIHAADRGGANQPQYCASYIPITPLGKSDPFAVFTLDGSKVYKSPIEKKTLNPEWNKTFQVNVVSRFVLTSIVISLSLSSCSLP